MELTNDDPMPFGQYKGKKMSDVPPQYLIWLAGAIQKSAAYNKMALVKKSVFRYVMRYRTEIENKLKPLNP